LEAIKEFKLGMDEFTKMAVLPVPFVASFFILSLVPLFAFAGRGFLCDAYADWKWAKLENFGEGEWGAVCG
jgi:hypothetical protein